MITTETSKRGKEVEERTMPGFKTNATFASNNPNNFVALCDGITFGAVDGVPFGHFHETFTAPQRVDWGKHNAMFFRALAERLERYAELMSQQIQADEKKPRSGKRRIRRS